jgi:biopolymer transport protein ExbD
MKRRAMLWTLLCGIIMGASSHPVSSQEKPPSARAKTPANSSAIVSIPANGEFYFGSDRITQAEIPGRIKEVFKDKPPDEQIVYIKAGLKVSYQTVVSVIEMIRGAGFEQIALVTDTDPDPKLRPRSPAGGAGKRRKVRRRRHVRRGARRELRSRSEVIPVPAPIA